jgi:hypothetical protein
MAELKITAYYGGNDFFMGVSPGGHSLAMETNGERGSAATLVDLLLVALGEESWAIVPNHFSRGGISPNSRPGLLAAILFTFVTSLAGQSYQGGVRGLVSDRQEAVVPGAKVTLTNDATRTARESVTNGDGQYVFTAVEPATYTIAVTATGFERTERKSVVVGTQQFLTIDFRLDVGSINQTVDVTAGVPVIDTSDASNGQVLDTQKLQNLPPPARNPYLFEKLDNNVVATGAITGSSKFQDQNGVSQVSIAGGPIEGNNYLVDGVPISDLANRSVLVPTIEATQEVTLQANTYDAEIGRTGGGTFNTVLKSGTNTLHGDAFGQMRQTDWSALQYFYTPGTPVNTNYSDQAAAIGGPVVIPRIYKGKNKTFFHLAEEGYHQYTPGTGLFFVPTLAERAGDFSASGVNIFDPFLTLVPCPAPYKSTQMCRQPFPANKIPTSLINPVGAAIAAMYPLPNQAVTAYGKPDFSNSAFPKLNAAEFVGKLDHQFFPWWYSNFSYMHYGSTQAPSNTLGIAIGAGGSQLLLRKVDAIAQNNTLTLSPTTVLTLGFGFNRFPNNSVDPSSGFSQASLGFPASYVNSLQKASFPGLTMQSAAPLGSSNPGASVYYSRSFVAGLAKNLGRHSLKVGYDFRSLSVDFADTTFANGQYAVANTFSEELPNAGNVSTGADIADLLFGLPTSGLVTTTTPLHLNVHYQGIYVQDNYRVSSRITLNFGLRYEYELGIRERNNQFVVGFNPNVTNPISSMSGVPTMGGVEFAGQNGYPDHCCDYSNTMFSPRVGIAFALFPKTTIRAGYGIFYAPAFYTANANVAPGFTQSNTYVASNDGLVTPANTLNNPFPTGIQQPSGNSLGYLTGIGNSLTVTDSSRHAPRVQQYSFDIQQELPWRMSLKVGYVGSKGTGLLASSANSSNASTTSGSANINQLPDQYLSLGAQLLTQVANPYYQHGGTGVIGSSTVADNQLFRPFPEFSTVYVATGTARSLYNALNIKLQKQLSQGVTIVAAYTWSSNWDSAWGTTNGINAGPGLPQDAYNLNGEYSRASDDIPQRLAIGSIVELPFGRGHALLAGNRVLDYIVGGWAVNAVALIQTGAPLSVYQNTNNNASIGAGVQRPTLIGNACYSGSPERRQNQYLNPAAFSIAPAFTYGDTPRTIPCLGPGLANWDLAITKDFHLTEKVAFQFRAEALNAFNTPQFSAPVTKFGAVTFGQLQTQANFSRFIELGGRISF